VKRYLTERTEGLGKIATAQRRAASVLVPKAEVCPVFWIKKQDRFALSLELCGL
jgi:hypothetical protein